MQEYQGSDAHRSSVLFVCMYTFTCVICMYVYVYMTECLGSGADKSCVSVCLCTSVHVYIK